MIIQYTQPTGNHHKSKHNNDKKRKKKSSLERFVARSRSGKVGNLGPISNSTLETDGGGNWIQIGREIQK